tara:strand:+ start:6966 stop:7463 length:498 start_codon:yes stop_codon:yes gene_type:complete
MAPSGVAVLPRIQVKIHGNVKVTEAHWYDPMNGMFFHKGIVSEEVIREKCKQCEEYPGSCGSDKCTCDDDCGCADDINESERHANTGHKIKAADECRTCGEKAAEGKTMCKACMARDDQDKAYDKPKMNNRTGVMESTFRGVDFRSAGLNVVAEAYNTVKKNLSE